jgi:hypothetical protein
MALITEKLSKFTKKNLITSPSVIADTSNKNKGASLLETEKAKGNLILKSLGDEDFSIWKTATGELKISTTTEKSTSGKSCMKLDIGIDHKADGGGEVGEYPVGWPRIYARFSAGELDLTKYEFLRLNVMIDSDRDEVDDDNTHAYWTFASHDKTKKLPAQSILGQVPQRVWIPIMIPVSKLIESSESPAPWKAIKTMQFGIGESHYKHGTKLTFYVDDISLISFKTPVIERVKIPSTITKNKKQIYCQLNTFGTSLIKEGDYNVTAELCDINGNVAASFSSDLKGRESFTLNANLKSTGKYTLKTNIKDKNGKTVSTLNKAIDIIPDILD